MEGWMGGCANTRRAQRHLSDSVSQMPSPGEHRSQGEKTWQDCRWPLSRHRAWGRGEGCAEGEFPVPRHYVPALPCPGGISRPHLQKASEGLSNCWSYRWVQGSRKERWHTLEPTAGTVRGLSLGARACPHQEDSRTGPGSCASFWCFCPRPAGLWGWMGLI